MDLRLRLLIDMAILGVAGLLAGLTVRFTGAPEWTALVAGVACGTLAGIDIFRAGYVDRPLWRWRRLEERWPDPPA